MEYHAAVCAQVPVDIWSLHNMTLREKRGEYGTDITLGIDAREGMLYGWRQQDDTERFERHVLVQRWAYIIRTARVGSKTRWDGFNGSLYRYGTRKITNFGEHYKELLAEILG